MQATGSVKVPDGKLVRVTATFDDTIEAVRITGDFFLEPPDAREELEAVIEGHSVDVTREELIEAIETVDATLIGFSPADLAEATLEAIR